MERKGEKDFVKRLLPILYSSGNEEGGVKGI